MTYVVLEALDIFRCTDLGKGRADIDAHLWVPFGRLCSAFVLWAQHIKDVLIFISLGMMYGRWQYEM